MTIQYASDLHLEFLENEYFIRNNPLKTGADILVLAGDIALFKELPKYDWFFDYVSENFGITYWIAGNHEYYHYDLFKKRGHFQEEIRHNVFLVNDFVIRHEHVRLIFATLWTDISPEKRIPIAKAMNDFHLIQYKKEWLTAEHLSAEHKHSLELIEHELKTKQEGMITIVATHHVPTFTNYPPEYLGSVLNQAFAVELKTMISSVGPDYWIYGHHHQNIPEFEIGPTKLLTNQLGYVKYNEHMLFNPDKRLEI
ncbi:metallophosphoesterase [Mucilaginibacter corticis]|uniref:Metallophosphoesterase n=1 Tax=Mucilaginibacter corticis TaxID=2597670 RepID=A0A556MIJ3_9SPHI|nr:metallophosphoesterase [Mucilaginibacter corticis]TSJ39708.1 metallophosphoesterase [Mucilaginibacter corticis]